MTIVMPPQTLERRGVLVIDAFDLIAKPRFSAVRGSLWAFEARAANGGLRSRVAGQTNSVGLALRHCPKSMHGSKIPSKVVQAVCRRASQ